MTISVRESGAASGSSILPGMSTSALRSELRRALFDLLGEAQKVAVNLKALRYIDSSGIATLIEVLKSAQRLQKQFVLFGLSPAVEDVFRLTHVNRIFQVFQTEEEAVTPA